jgi:hypothetical protein
MGDGFVIGLGTAVLIGVIAALLLRGRFGAQPRRPGEGDPSTVWLKGDRTETPPERDMATHGNADDPSGPDSDGAASDGPDGSGANGGGAGGGGADGP